MEEVSALVCRLIEPHPIVAGVAATLVAAVAIMAWIAIGGLLLPRSIRDSEDVAAPASIIVGSSATGFAYAMMTRAGIVDGAMVLVGSLSLVAVVVNRDHVSRIIRGAAVVFRETTQKDFLLRFAAPVTALLLWTYAIAPPRDGDVMRYHLAHVRQIISDGAWQPIADYHYAFPFGWTLNYLPFERLHLPQAAGLVNVALWLAILSTLLRLASRSEAPRAGQYAAVVFFVHPFVIRTSASAMADAYAMLVVVTIAVLLLRLDDGDDSVLLLGFVCWIGAQSRYQLVGFGIAASCIVFILIARRRSTRSLTHFFVGSAIALILSSPFYLANLKLFRNPVWPLLLAPVTATTPYVDRVAAAYNIGIGSFAPTSLLSNLWKIVSAPALVPLALLVLLVVPASIRARPRQFRRVGVLGSMFIVLWMVMEPRPFPRHVLLLVPLAALVMVPALDGIWARPRIARSVVWTLGAGIVLMIAASAVFSWDYTRYAVTGDKATFHRFTWYYDVYEWVNQHTPREARVLVIVYSGHSYYLDRPYRRADPWLSGVVDWSRVSSPEDLMNVLRSGGYSFVIYDDRKWNGFPSGDAMQNAVRSAMANGSLVPVHQQSEQLYTSRVKREFSKTNVYVLRVASGVASDSDGGSTPGGKYAFLKRAKKSGGI